jgi:homoserine dehydrogenase
MNRMPGANRADHIGVGLLGAGTVGAAVAGVLAARDSRSAPALKLLGAVVRDTSKARAVPFGRGVLSTDPAHVLGNPDVKIVIEVMGGEQPAFDYISRALNSGKHVVTANKEVLCKRGDALLALAARNGVHLLYEASVGGGIPIIGPLTSDLGANRILSIRAIINGTTNYILTRMAQDGAAFADALKEAQSLGYAEADPTNDVDAFDAAYKLTILARTAFKTDVPLGAVYREGIRGVDAKDFRYARELGFNIKLIAAAQLQDGAVIARVHPAFVPASVPMANVNGVLNAVEVEGDLAGPLWFQGRGAGPSPTASAVLGDVLRIARQIAEGVKAQQALPAAEAAPLRVADIGLHTCRYYLRLTARDRAGVLARIAGVLGEAQISIRSVLQMDTDEERGVADLVIMTHAAKESSVQAAAVRLRQLEVVAALDNLIRVESYAGSK